MSTAAIAEIRNKAMGLEAAGRRADARSILEEALKDSPVDAGLANTAGNMAMRDGAHEEAERLFGLAAKAMPNSLEFALNHAIALAAIGRHREVAGRLEPFEAEGRNQAKYCSVRANSARLGGSPGDAARWYDAALDLEPQHARALHGRARAAIECGEADALRRFDAALAVNQGDPDLWLGRAQALDVDGRSEEARQIMEQLAEQAPHWIDGLRFLAQLRLADRDADWDLPFSIAAQRVPQDPNIAMEHYKALESLDRYAEAAEVAKEAQTRFPDAAVFRLYEAMAASASAQLERASRLFESLKTESPERMLQEGRHEIRTGKIERAEALLSQSVASDPHSVGGWALLGIAWRLLGDSRGTWLHEQAGLVELLPLQGADEVLPAVEPILHELHEGSPFPLGQSLRGGTQTRGKLFDRREPQIERLHQAISATLEGYRSALPSADPEHPLLRYRDAPWRITGSWSVRLSGGDGDHHTSHIHPHGIISSALYCVVPEDAANAEQHGWLEIGRPPVDLHLDLPPLRTIEPKEGHLALFPSTLYHGTTPFAEAQRMTVAFDVTAQQESGA